MRRCAWLWPHESAQGCFPPALGSSSSWSWPQPPSPLHSLASSSPSLLSPQLHPGAPGVASMDPAGYSRAIFWWGAVGPWLDSQHPLPPYFCPTFYFKNFQTISIWETSARKSCTLEEFHAQYRLRVGTLCTPGHDHAQLSIPGQYAGLMCVWTQCPILTALSLVAACFNAGSDLCIWPSSSLVSFGLDCLNL